MPPLPLYEAKTKNHLRRVRKILGVCAGKGGVGKSSMTALIAMALKQMGHKVGILDADLYGPSQRRLFPEKTRPKKSSHALIPGQTLGIEVMTFAYFRQEHESLSLRAPLATQLTQQFLRNVDFGPLDFLLIDFPPGTGDIPITLCEQGILDAAMLVTTAQQLSLQDVHKAMTLLKQTGVNILGIIENMSYYVMPDGGRLSMFGTSQNVQDFAEANQVPVLGQIPLDPTISTQCDQGFHELFVPQSVQRLAEQILKLLVLHNPTRTGTHIRPQPNPSSGVAACSSSSKDF